MKLIFVSFLIGFLLIGCNPVSAPTGAVTLVPPTSPGAAASPTAIQLPFDPDASSDDYCKPPYAFLQTSDNGDLSEEEIVFELVQIWLKRYASPDAPPFCRIDGFTIDRVYDNPDMYANSLEPKGDFMRIVLFSVKLIQVPTDWMSFAGNLDQDNWLHTGHIVAISKINEGHKLEFAYP